MSCMATPVKRAVTQLKSREATRGQWIAAVALPAADQIRAVAESLEEGRDVGGVILAVAVDRDDRRALRMVESGGEGGRLAEPAPEANPAQGRPVRDSSSIESGGSIGRAVVDDDRLPADVKREQVCSISSRSPLRASRSLSAGITIERSGPASITRAEPTVFRVPACAKDTQVGHADRSRDGGLGRGRGAARRRRDEGRRHIRRADPRRSDQHLARRQLVRCTIREPGRRQARPRRSELDPVRLRPRVRDRRPRANIVAGNDSSGEVSSSASAHAVRHLIVALIALLAGVGSPPTVWALTRSWRFGVWGAAALFAIPAWTGQALFNVKDVPAAAGYTLVTAGLVVALCAPGQDPDGTRSRDRSPDRIRGLHRRRDEALAMGSGAGVAGLICRVAGRPEVVVVDDGSVDGAHHRSDRGNLARGQGRIRGVRLRRRFGKSVALAAGFEGTQGATIVTIDGDGQDDPADIQGLPRCPGRRRGPGQRLEARPPRSTDPQSRLQGLQLGDRALHRRRHARHEQRLQWPTARSASTRSRSTGRCTGSCRCWPPAGVACDRGAGQPSGSQLRQLSVRHRALPARRSRPPDRDLHRPLRESPSAPLRRHRAGDDRGRDGARHLPRDPEADRRDAGRAAAFFSSRWS